MPIVYGNNAKLKDVGNLAKVGSTGRVEVISERFSGLPATMALGKVLYSSGAVDGLVQGGDRLESSILIAPGPALLTGLHIGTGPASGSGGAEYMGYLEGDSIPWFYIKKPSVSVSSKYYGDTEWSTSEEARVTNVNAADTASGTASSQSALTFKNKLLVYNDTPKKIILERVLAGVPYDIEIQLRYISIG